VVVNKPNPNPSDPVPEAAGETSDPVAEDFFQRLPTNLRWPKPNAEAVAAAMEAIQRLSGTAAADLAVELQAPSRTDASTSSRCSGCGQALVEGMVFCGYCGMQVPTSAPVPGAAAPSAGTHHYHHHYHHFVPSAGAGAAANSSADLSAALVRPAGSPAKSAPGSRAELAARQVVQDWAQACNIKHLDDLLELYAPDATVIRSNIQPVRSLSAIREFLFSLLEAGLGDVEMESLRLEMLGEVAVDLGRCKMLVPVAMGKRREERGKYLVVLIRQPTGVWKILADCWSSDLSAVAPVSDPAHKIAEPASVRKPR
jgi:ketosteroid isomerase-like protein